MKKVITFVLIAVMVCAMPVVAYATELKEDDSWKNWSGGVDEMLGITTPVETTPVPTTPAPTTPAPTTPAPTTPAPTTPAPTTPAPTTPASTAPATTTPVADTKPFLPSIDEGMTAEEKQEIELTTAKIVEYVQDHLEELSVIITLILTVFYQMRKHGLLNKTIGTLNNNAVTVAEKSTASMAGMSTAVNDYTNEMRLLLAEVRANEDEKMQLRKVLDDATAFLKTAKMANVEFSNELAELLVLSNIPNSKKEELYSRHLAAVNAISAAEQEVNNNVGEEA